MEVSLYLLSNQAYNWHLFHRNLFAISSNNATDLALVVQYIRRELQALEKYGGENLNAGIVKFDKPDATFVW